MKCELIKRASRKLHHTLRRMAWHFRSFFQDRWLSNTKQGLFEIYADDNTISYSLYVYGHYELDLADSVLTLLRSVQLINVKGEGCILDIGANNGFISIGMLTKGEFKSAIAIEPAATNFERLCKNVKNNGLESRIRCLNLAASNSDRPLVMELSNVNQGDHRIHIAEHAKATPILYQESERSTTTVASNKIDNLMLLECSDLSEDISLIWLDVQGYELQALKGASNLLKRGVPVVCEVWPYGMRRVGTDKDSFVNFAKEYWRHFYIKDKGNSFVKKHIDELDSIYQSLGFGHDYLNLVFVK